MNEHNHNLPRPLVSAVLAWLCCFATGMAELNAQTFPPPVGAGIAAMLQADQYVYTNQPAGFWCPPCTTNVPPCMLPCYLIEEKTAGAPAAGLVLLTNTPRRPTPKLYDYVIIEGYPAGQFHYKPVPNVDKIIRRFSARIEAAVRQNMAE